MKRYIAPLDGLRAIAALMVMWFHFFSNPAHMGSTGISAFLFKTSTIGQTGVDLFFVLSGFLITRILLNDKHGTDSFRNFYIRRILRIAPLYYAYLFFFLLIQPRLAGQSIPTIGSCWWSLVFLQNIPQALGFNATVPSHFWSLAVEEHFYLAWPFLVLLLNRRYLKWAIFSMIVISIGLRLFLIDQGVNVYYLTLTRLDALSVGAFIALMEPFLVKRGSELRMPIFVSIVISAVPLLFLYGVISGRAEAAVQVVKYSFIALLYGLVVAAALIQEPHSILYKLLASILLRWIGRISYSLYVWHSICFFWVEKWLPSFSIPVLMLVSFVVSACVAQLSYRLVEFPFLTIKDRLTLKTVLS